MTAERVEPRRRELPVLATRSSGVPAERRPRENGAAAGVRIGLITLGCDKNTVDSERLLADLLAAGARVSGKLDGADVVVVNTCGFIDVAKEESVDAILDAVRLKEKGRVRTVVAVGCLVQRYKDDLLQELPEVDLMLGTTEADRLVPELRRRGVLPPVGEVPIMERPLRVLSTSARHSSYLKISEGCDHGCAFCAIPLMRGKHRSTPIERLTREARELEAAGVVELNIISQDTTWYGRDLVRGGTACADGPFFVGQPFEGMSGLRPGERATTQPAALPASPRSRVAGPASDAHAARDGLLPELLLALLGETGIPWLRLFYLYPSGITRRLVETIAAEPRILPYVDMPIQHGADAVLKRMRRPERRATIRERVRWLRNAIPDVALRTTVIVGFPGETEDDFEAMLELLEELRFDHLGAFPYSTEEGTAAAVMPGRVADSLRRERLERVLELQGAIALEKNEARVGRETTVLVERTLQATREGAAAVAIARAPWQAPELDGVVRLLAGTGRGEADARVGSPLATAAASPPERVAGSGEGRPVGRPEPGTFVQALILEVRGTSEDDLVARIQD